MFNKSNLKAMTGAAFVVLTLAVAMWPKAALARFPYNHMSHDSCVVNSEYWGGYSGDWDWLTFPRALYHANIQTGRDVACNKEIAIAKDKIVMTRPIEIQANGDSDNGFVIRGGCSSMGGANSSVCTSAYHTGRTVFEVSRNFEGSGNCVITITGNYVMLQDIKVTNVPAGKKAICIKGDGATMDGVVIESAGGDGFVFDNDSGGGLITFRSGAKNVDGFVIDFGVADGEYLTSSVFLEPYDSETRLPATDENGLQLPTGEKFEIINSDVNEYFKNDSSPLQICIKNRAAQSDSDFVTVNGWVKDMTTGDDLRSACISDKARRLQLWDAAGFLGYVGQWNEAAGTGMGGNTFDREGVMRGRTGYFNFKLSNNGEPIMVVPEDAQGRLGKPISFDRSGGPGECRDEELGDTTCGDTGTIPGNDKGDVEWEGFSSFRECTGARGIVNPGDEGGTEIGNPDHDTDGDDLPDDQEDADFDCECDSKARDDATDETCWYKPDTDDDGIADKVEGAANAVDPDRDDDGLKDGEEDRYQFMFTTSAGGTTVAQNYLFEYRTFLSPDPLQKADGSGDYVTCDLGPGFNNIGIRYRWYTKTPGHDPEAFTGDFPDSNVSGAEIKLYVCKNASLSRGENFNGIYDENNLELDLENPDTDDDNWCDGDGALSAAGTNGCSFAGSQGVNKADACPLVSNETAADCKRQYPCRDDQQMFYSVNYRYVVREGGALRLRDGLPGKSRGAVQPDGSIAGNEVADVLEVASPCTTIPNLCGDMDQDGIPDCVESPSGKCTDRDDPIGLKYYREDTDEDGLIDGYRGEDNEDMCPVTGSTIDRFTENGTYSCRPQDFYKLRPILACFLDRDNDGLWDAQEDKDGNGEYDNIRDGIDGIGTTESNALSKDSDGDTIMDNEEVNGWGDVRTNPSDADTDDDSLNDNVEDRDGDGRITVTTLEGMGCAAYFGDPTDPASRILHDTNPAMFDTDGDGLTDGAEIDGAIPSDADFQRMILDPASWTGGGLVVGSSPLAKDSDADGLDDNVEYNGDRVTWYDSNPCMRDSDGDSRIDRDELRGCRLNPDARCVGSADGGTGGGMDSDEDGLPDDMERALGTNENLPDTDGDGVWDGMEDSNHNGIREPNLGESDPTNPDTDGDGMNDGMEVRYGTDATNADTDGDCISDGIEDANRNGQFDPTETCAAVTCTAPDGATVNGSDTDGDGLPDGRIRGIGEDMGGQEGSTACNGIRDVAPDGGFLETDPTNPDSDYDGNDDRSEMFEGGSFNVSNVGRANNGQEGCSMMGALGRAPTSMYYLLGLVLFATRVARRKLQGR